MALAVWSSCSATCKHGDSLTASRSVFLRELSVREKFDEILPQRFELHPLQTRTTDRVKLCCLPAVKRFLTREITLQLIPLGTVLRVWAFITTYTEEVMFSSAFVGLFVIRITQKQLLRRLSQNSAERQHMSHERND